MLATEALQILDMLEGQEFLECTYIAGDHSTVAAIIHDMWEVKSLLEDKHTNFPLMLIVTKKKKQR